MKINLAEIPAEGRNYTFNRETGELNKVLQDLLEDRPYEVDFLIRPMGNAYELKGWVKAKVPDICSKCGTEMEATVDRNFKEFLLEEDEEYRKSHSVHGNQSIDFLTEGPSVANYRGSLFDAGEYIHEAIALGEASYPLCGGDHCLHSEEIEKIQEDLKNSFLAALAEEGHPGFSVLKNLQLPDDKSK